MQTPLRLSFRGFRASPAVAAACEREAEKLEQFEDRLTSCRVTVSRPHRRHVRGDLFDVRIHVTLPGGELVVDRTPPEHTVDEDLGVALREAFDAMRRRIEDFVRRRHRPLRRRVPPSRSVTIP